MLLIASVFLVVSTSCEKDEDYPTPPVENGDNGDNGNINTSWSEGIWKRNNMETYIDLNENPPLFCANGSLVNDQANFSAVTWADSDNGYFSITSPAVARLHLVTV